MRLHFQHILDLHQVDLFPIAQAYDFIKRPEQLERILQNFPLFGCAAHIRHDASEQMECVNVLEDVGGFIGDEEDI